LSFNTFITISSYDNILTENIWNRQANLDGPKEGCTEINYKYPGCTQLVYTSASGLDTNG